MAQRRRKLRWGAVCWRDAEASARWDPEDPAPPPHIWSLGFILHTPTRKEPWVTICGDIGADGLSYDSDKNRYLKIPSGMIVDIIYLGDTDGENLFWDLSH